MTQPTPLEMNVPQEIVAPEAIFPFESLPLRADLLKNLPSLGYTSMTTVQAQSLPMMLDGVNLIAQAETGSGKTVAFGLAILNQLKTDEFAVQALVLCPTRELAEQVSQVLRRLARLLANIKILNLSGGIPMKPQLDSLKHGAHIIVGTPGRIQKHLNKGTLILNRLQAVVLDEADRMLDMGFLDSIKSIMTACPTRRQTLLFSATYPAQIQKLSREVMTNPKKLLIDAKKTAQDIEQRFYKVNHESSKYALLKAMLVHFQSHSTLIFCNTKLQVSRLHTLLKQEAMSVVALNGDMEQMERDLAIIRFTNHSCSILVATDVAARGLDIKDLPLIINYDLAFEHDTHIHRIGRTGRAGNKGLALSITTPDDEDRLRLIQNNLAIPIKWGNLGELTDNKTALLLPQKVTLCLNAGRKEKLRAGDILGALTKDAGLPGHAIGKIDIGLFQSFVAVDTAYVQRAFEYLQNGKIKARKVQVRKLL